jgi:hypothetical protein
MQVRVFISLVTVGLVACSGPDDDPQQDAAMDGSVQADVYHCPDTDLDGVCDAADVCPAGDDTVDTDGDGVPDACDPCPADDPDDTDGDGVCDAADVCPAGDDTVDTDGDGVPDACDPCPADDPDDSDGDGVCDAADVCPAGDDTVDTDGDGVPDACDPCPADDPDDTDGDGVCDAADVCPAGDDTLDADGDGVPDACDPCPADNPDDADGDGVCTSEDLCLAGADDLDADGDLVPDACDNCPSRANPGQEDTSGVSARSIPFAPEVADGSALVLSDDSTSEALPLGFSFEFFGTAYTELYVLSNGLVTFEIPAVSGCCRGGGIPYSGDSLNGLIALAWTDLDPESGGSITYQARGVAPDRRFVVTFTDVPWCCSTENPSVAVQLILYEGTNVIEVHTTRQPAGSIYTRGVEDLFGTLAAVLNDERNLDFALDQSAVRYTTGTTPDLIGDACSDATDLQYPTGGGS